MTSDVDRGKWPFEAIIHLNDGSHEYHQYARDNNDGTVSVYEFHLPSGYTERTYAKEKTTLTERPWEKARRWHELYNSVYGKGGGHGERR